MHDELIEQADKLVIEAGFNDNDESSSMASLYARLEYCRRELEERLKEVKKQQTSLVGYMTEQMSLHGVTNISVRGLTLSPYEDVIVEKKAEKDGVSTAMLCQALREMGYEDLVSEGYSGSKVKALVLAALKEEGEVPEELVDLVRVTRLTRMSAKSNGKKE